MSQKMRKKAMTHKLYDYTKGGIDIPDQRMGSYTSNPKLCKWTITALSYILDIARINSQATYVINNKINTTDSFIFDWELTEALVLPHMKKRLLKGVLSKPLQQSVSLFVGAVVAAKRHPQADDNIPCRCPMCLNETHGDGHKEAKNSIGKVKSCYCKCNHSFSRKHVVSLCKNCSE